MPPTAQPSASSPGSTSADAAHEHMLARAFAHGSAEDVAHTLGLIARARGMTHVARRSGLAREALYRALSRGGDPKLSTLMRVFHALDIRLDAEMDRSAGTEMGTDLPPR